MGDPRDSVEIEGLKAEGAEGGPGGAAGACAGRKKFLGLWFRCANVYARAHPDPSGTEYRGRCPRCAKTVAFPIGEGGTSRRMFEVRCD
jgi:hypothetical protein